MARIPFFVSSVKQKNEVATFINGEWVLSRRTTRYDKETQKSQSITIPVAVASIEGRRPYQSNSPAAEICPFESHEYGYSYVLKLLIPKQWLTSLKEDGEAIFLALIQLDSPNSYLLRNVGEIKLPEDRNLNIQIKRFWKKIGGEEMRKKLEPLKSILIIKLEDRFIIQKPNPQAQAVLDSLSIQLEAKYI